MIRKVIVGVLCLMLAVAFAMPVMASGGAEVDQLQQRIDSLEKQLNELKQVLQQQQQMREEDKVRVEQIEQKVQSTEKVVAEAAPRVLSKFQFKPYGYVKLDASYNDSRTNGSDGDFIIFVPNESVHKNDNDFSMTIRQTRLGMNIIAPKSGEWEALGRIEVDLYGNAAHENKSELMVRHAYLQLTRANFSLLAGQTSDLISPLFPSTLNYTVGWGAGNIGYRRAQLRLTYDYPVNERNKLTTAFAIARTTGTINEDFDFDGYNDGDDAGFPTVQGRIALSTKLLTDKASVFGISGHYGKEEMDLPARQIRAKTWSVNGDFDLPLSACLSLKGEIFAGYNLDDYFGGILQGINAGTQDIIKTRGGWAQLSYAWSSELKYNAGFGIDDPSNDDLSAGMRGRNSFYFANVNYQIIPPVTVGLEYSYWNTEYIDRSNGTDNRLQASIIYKW
ncbi:MAG: hypothetical protein JXD19_03400 [Deltaproteobacteria bacterium]|nr:hypothetical protein [Deltaproteobacteria bacterium]